MLYAPAKLNVEYVRANITSHRISDATTAFPTVFNVKIRLLVTIAQLVCISIAIIRAVHVTKIVFHAIMQMNARFVWRVFIQTLAVLHPIHLSLRVYRAKTIVTNAKITLFAKIVQLALDYRLINLHAKCAQLTVLFVNLIRITSLLVMIAFLDSI